MTTRTGTTRIPCCSTSSSGRYAVESVTIATAMRRRLSARPARAAGPRCRSTRPRDGLGRHDVDELGRADDDGPHLAPGQGALDRLGREGQDAQLVLGDGRRDLEAVPDLP